MIRCENLVKIFRSGESETVALQGLDLRVAKGELIAVMGASGSGKSTLLNVIGCMIPPDAGRVIAIRDGRVSGELHRVREGKTVDRTHEEYAVIDKNGFVQIPKAVPEKAKMGDQVIFSSENEGEILIKKKHSDRTAEK